MPRMCESCFEKQAYYNYEGLYPLYCKLCTLEGMINVVSKKPICEYIGCKTQPSYNYKGEIKRRFCLKHCLNGMINVVANRKCQFVGCKKNPIYNYEGELKGTYCVTHKKEDMIDIAHKKCKYPKCKTRPSYNYERETKGIYCLTHKKTGMINVVDKKCQQPGCKKIPIYNYEGKSKGIYCVTHKTDQMIDVMTKKCQKEGCKKVPNFNHKGESKGIYCATHKEKDMINVRSVRCKHDGCEKQPSYNYKDETRAMYCFDHRLADMVNITYKLCIEPNCEKYATHGLLFEEKKHCMEHSGHNEYRDNHPKCNDCNERAYWTDLENNYPLTCETHKKENSKNIVERPCKNCKLTYFIKDGLDLCNDCYDFTVKEVHKVKETRIKNLLDRNKIKYESYDKIIKNGCSKYRPDFVIDYGLFHIVLEVDENQHKSYPCECEQTRMVQIFQDFGGTPLLFIRFNPDEYVDSEGTIVKDYRGREIRLLAILKIINERWSPKYPLNVAHLYYDGYDPKSRKPNIKKINYENDFNPVSSP